MQQRQLRAIWLLCSTRFFGFVSSLKLSRRLLCSVRFVFVSTFKPPTRKIICRWNHQFEQIGCLCKGKSSGRPRVSEENVRRIQESFERSPRKSTRRASREILNTATNYLACVEAPFTVQAISYLSIVLIFKYRLTKLSLFFFNHAVFQNHRHHNYKIIRGNYRKLENKNIGCC